jgi:hypothetical protein
MLLGGAGGGWLDSGPWVLKVEKRLSGSVGGVRGVLRWAGGSRICKSTGLSSWRSMLLAIDFSSSVRIHVVNSLS